MKSLNEYIYEKNKNYNFKVKVAGEIPKDFDDKLENALNKYVVKSFSKGKTTPITEKPLDFPQLQNCEVTTYDITLNYPTTSGVLESYISLELGFPDTHLTIRNENDPLEEYQEKEKNTEYKTLLTSEIQNDKSAQKDVGSTRVMDLLKELEKAKKENEFDPIKGISAPKE